MNRFGTAGRYLRTLRPATSYGILVRPPANMARGEAISLTGRPFPNSSNDIAECGIPELLLRGLLAFAGFAVFQIDFGDISFLIVELGPDDRFAGFQRLGHIEDALVSGAAELQQRVLLVSEVAAVDENVDEM